MADKNLRVNLIANTSKFKSAMSKSSNQIKLLNSEFKNASAETDKYGNKVDSTGAKQKQLSGLVDQHKNRIRAITEEQKHWTNELKEGNITEDQHSQKQQELSRRLNNTEAQMKNYEGQLKRINKTGKTTSRTYADFDKQFRNVGRTIRNTSAKVGIASGVGFMAMKRVLGNVIGEAKDFEFGMSEVKAISGATGKQMEKLTKQAKDLGKQTKFTAQEASKSQASLARAGFKTNEIYDAMPGILDLAASSNIELDSAADITANTLRGFNKDAKESGHVADVLAKGAATANTDVEGLGQSMEKAAPIANSLGIDMESVAAATGEMADSGIDGSKAGRMLRQGMLRLSKPVGEAGSLIDELGINVFDANGNMKSLDGVVGELQKGLKGQSKQAKSAALSTIFGSESTAGWNVLIEKGSSKLKDYTGDLENSDGAAKDMADTMQGNAEGALIKMQSALSGLKIELGEKLLPLLGKGADYVSDFANKLSDMDDSTIETIAQAGLLVTGVLGVTTAVAGLTAGIGALMAFAGPVGLAITGGTALLAGLAAVIYKNKKKTEDLKKEQAKAKQEALDYGDNLSEGTRKGVKGYEDLYSGARTKMAELRTMSGKKAKKTSEDVVKAFSEMADKVIAELETQRDKMADAINEVYGIAGEAGKKGAKEMTNKVIESFDKDIADYRRALDVVKEADKKYNSDMSKMPDKFAKRYQDALKVMEGGSKEFAKTQDELVSIRKNVSEKEGKVLNKDAQGYIQKTNETYEKSLKNANKWYADKQEIFEQALAQGRISEEDYKEAMTGVEASTNQMVSEAVVQYKKNKDEIAKHLDDRGELIDIENGKVLKKNKDFIRDSNGVTRAVTESDEDYLKRWVKNNEKHLDSFGNFSDNAQKAYKESMVNFLKAQGESEEEAVKTAEKVLDETINGLSDDEKKSKKKGEKAIKNFSEGIDDTKEKSDKSAKKVSDGADDELGKNKKSAHKHGEDKGTEHKKGLGSTFGINFESAKKLKDSVLGALDNDKGEPNKSGKKKGSEHKRGLNSTKKQNSMAASIISKGVTRLLASTTDGGGGSKAGNLFNKGINGWIGKVYSSGTSVASSGKAGLKAVSTAGAGDGFVAGFRHSIAIGSVFDAAWSLGQKALSALTKSIDSHSPSKETGKLGNFFNRGFIDSILGGVKESKKSAEMLGRESVESLSNEIKKYKDNFIKLSTGIEQNKQSFEVNHKVDNGGLEDKILMLGDVLERLIKSNSDNKRESTNSRSVVMNVNVRGQDDIDKIDALLNNKGERVKKAWGGE